MKNIEYKGKVISLDDDMKFTIVGSARSFASLNRAKKAIDAVIPDTQFAAFDVLKVVDGGWQDDSWAVEQVSVYDVKYYKSRRRYGNDEIKFFYRYTDKNGKEQSASLNKWSEVYPLGERKALDKYVAERNEIARQEKALSKRKETANNSVSKKKINNLQQLSETLGNKTPTAQL